MSIADSAIATSGTVILEAALLNLPCIVLYKMATLNYFIARQFVDIKYFSLPNILADKKILPELLQDEVEPKKISEEVLKLYRGDQNREKVIEELKNVCAKLGSPGSAARVAEKILSAAKPN